MLTIGSKLALEVLASNERIFPSAEHECLVSYYEILRSQSVKSVTDICAPRLPSCA